MDPRYTQSLLDALRGQEPFAQVTLVEISGSAPQEVGARMLVRSDGSQEGTVGGGALEYRLIQEAHEALASGSPRLLHLNLKKDVGMCCGGAVRAFIEPIQTATPLIIFGCGHVSRALAPLVARLGFSLTVVDDRPEWADPRAFPEGTNVVCQEIDAFCATLEGVSRHFILAMTRGHSFDFEVLRHFVTRNTAYLGIMASKNKARTFGESLVQDYQVPAELVDRVAMPVGLKIGSQTPEEIAVSIAAQLVQERRAVAKARESV
jgi:xanthine dehydrogenase accessory factor